MSEEQQFTYLMRIVLVVTFITLSLLVLLRCAPSGDEQPELIKGREQAYRCGIIVGSRFIDFKPLDDNCRRIRKEFEH